MWKKRNFFRKLTFLEKKNEKMKRRIRRSQKTKKKKQHFSSLFFFFVCLGFLFVFFFSFIFGGQWRGRRGEKKSSFLCLSFCFFPFSLSLSLYFDKRRNSFRSSISENKQIYIRIGKLLLKIVAQLRVIGEQILRSR